jgi:SAM-dependent methyltransferase
MHPDVQKNIWDREQVQRIRRGFDTNKRRLGLIYRHITRMAETQRRISMKVLNVGIGNGYLEALLLEGGFDVYSLDPSENAIQAITEKLGVVDGRFRVGSAAAMPFGNGFFDFVVMSEVIEHLDDITLADCLKELRRVLKPGGSFLGTCPDDEDLSRNTVICPHCGEKFHRVGHTRNFTQRSLRDLLSLHFGASTCRSFRGMHLNWKGLIFYWYNVFPFRLARLFRPSVRIPQHIGCHLFFKAVNSRPLV